MFLSVRIGAAGNGSSRPSGYAGVGVGVRVGIEVAVGDGVKVGVKVGGNGVTVGDAVAVGEVCVAQADKPVPSANRRNRTTKMKFDFMVFSFFSIRTELHFSPSWNDYLNLSYYDYVNTVYPICKTIKTARRWVGLSLSSKPILQRSYLGNQVPQRT